MTTEVKATLLYRDEELRDPTTTKCLDTQFQTPELTIALSF
jgi:hypothetical protein